jgi:hypothetical protein
MDETNVSPQQIVRSSQACPEAAQLSDDIGDSTDWGLAALGDYAPEDDTTSAAYHAAFDPGVAAALGVLSGFSSAMSGYGAMIATTGALYNASNEAAEENVTNVTNTETHR